MKTVMIIDDDKNFIETLNDGIKENIKDVEIITSSSVKEALVILAEKKPDLIICDMQLEDMNGFDFLKTIKSSARLKDVPVILISAKYTEPLDRVNALKLGAKGYYVKPVDVGDLCEDIKYYLKK